MKFNKLIPELSVSNFEKSLEFYKSIGFEVEYKRKDFAFISLQGSQLMLEKSNSVWKISKLKKPYGQGVNFQIEVKSVKKILEKLDNLKYKIVFDLEENCYNVNGKKICQKEFLVQDPDGYLLRFCQEIKN